MCSKRASNDDQRSPAFKRNDPPPRPQLLVEVLELRAIEKATCSRCPGSLRTRSSMIVGITVEAGFVAKHYAAPVSIIPN
ncbi:hypothetical protein TNCV_2770501 [Trichonephila clavipes]|nr:hypothetical protein TNCV_2770501 [Trichonephila clavipes]